MKHRKKNRFWQIYGIVIAAVAFLLVLGLIVFYNFIASYEASQPQNAAELYLNDLSEEKVMLMVNNAMNSLELNDEECNSYVDVYLKAWKENTAVCRKDLVNGTNEKPVYSIICGDVEVCRLTLGKSEKGSFGFENWEVVSAETPVDAITKNAKKYSVYIPGETKLYVNGVDVTSADKEFVRCPVVSSLENTDQAMCALYELGTFYSEPSIKCISEEGECVSVNKNGVIMYVLPGFEVKDYMISVPSGASVSVNGTVLDDSYIVQKDVPYPYSEYEVGMTDLPTQTVYRTGELFHVPQVKVTHDEKELKFSVKNNKIIAESPKYSLTVKVPEGAVITVNGKSVTETPVKENVFEGLLLQEINNTPIFDVYTIEGLYLSSADVKGTLGGVELDFFSGTTTSDDGYSILYTADYSTVVDETVGNFAMKFIETYFYYIYHGYSNTDANMLAVLGYVQPGSDLYRDVQGSKIGIEFHAVITSLEYKQLGVSDMFVLDDGSYVVKVVYDVVETYGSVVRLRAGEISLHIVNGGYGMKIDAMVIDKK